MLPRARRVPKGLFPLIIKQGRSWHSPFLSLRIWRREGEEFLSKFSVVAGKKISIKAVERNLWKRRSRAVIIKMLKQIKDNYYCLLYLKPTVKSLSHSQLSQKIKDIFNQARLLNH